MCRAKELGGLGISDLKSLSCSLRVRWPWLMKTEPNKPWASLSLQVSKEVEDLLAMAVCSEVGKFVLGQWLSALKCRQWCEHLVLAGQVAGWQKHQGFGSWFVCIGP